MVVQQPVNAKTVGCKYAELIRGLPGVRELWARPVRDHIDLYLIVDGIDADAERRLYGLSGDLYELFPNLRFQLFVRNPLNFVEGTDLRASIPKGAQQIPLGD